MDEDIIAKREEGEQSVILGVIESILRRYHPLSTNGPSAAPSNNTIEVWPLAIPPANPSQRRRSPLPRHEHEPQRTNTT
jgi:hypothetical protein